MSIYDGPDTIHGVAENEHTPDDFWTDQIAGVEPARKPRPIPVLDVKGEQTETPFVPTASEALYVFMGWLTTREQPIIIGSRIDCVPIVGLIAEFCRVNNIPDPRDDVKWNLLMKHPEAPLKR